MILTTFSIATKVTLNNLCPVKKTIKGVNIDAFTIQIPTQTEFSVVHSYFVKQNIVIAKQQQCLK